MACFIILTAGDMFFLFMELFVVALRCLLNLMETMRMITTCLLLLLLSVRVRKVLKETLG